MLIFARAGASRVTSGGSSSSPSSSSSSSSSGSGSSTSRPGSALPAGERASARCSFHEFVVHRRSKAQRRIIVIVIADESPPPGCVFLRLIYFQLEPLYPHDHLLAARACACVTDPPLSLPYHSGISVPPCRHSDPPPRSIPRSGTSIETHRFHLIRPSDVQSSSVTRRSLTQLYRSRQSPILKAREAIAAPAALCLSSRRRPTIPRGMNDVEEPGRGKNTSDDRGLAGRVRLLSDRDGEFQSE